MVDPEFIFLSILLCISTIYGSHFRGGTISWKFSGSNNTVVFKYKLAWTSSGNPATWIAQDGSSSTTLYSGRNYTTVIRNTEEGWEEGENTFQYNMAGLGPYSINFTGNAWISLGGGRSGGNWKLETTLDLHQRSDTNLPNHSPQASHRLVYRVPYDSGVTVHIPVLDTDGDRVKCRWSTSDEAASVAGPLPNSILDEENCQLRFTSTAANGYDTSHWFVAAITIEDFPKETIVINGKIYTPGNPISKIPLQVLLRPELNFGSRTDIPVFLLPTLPEGKVILLPAGKTLDISFYMYSNSGVSDLSVPGDTEIISSVVQPDDQHRVNVYKVDMSWTPMEAHKGTNVICATAVDKNGNISDNRCFFVTAWVVDPCTSYQCTKPDTCIITDVLEYPCSSIYGYTTEDQPLKISTEIDRISQPREQVHQ